MVYELMLDEAVARLTDVTVGLGGTVEVERLPETEAAYKRAFAAPQVYVGYNSSEFSEQKSTAQAFKEEIVTLELSVKSRKLYGVEGVYDLVRRIRILLHGFQFTGAARRTLIKNIMPGKDPFEKGVWQYLMVFETTWPIIQFDDETILANQLTHVTINDPELC